MLCSGLNQYEIPGVGKIAFGGLDLVDLHVHVAIHQVPVTSWIKPDLVMSSNPFSCEIHDNRMRFYFIPEDDNSTLYVFDAGNVERATMRN